MTNSNKFLFIILIATVIFTGCKNNKENISSKDNSSLNKTTSVNNFADNSSNNNTTQLNDNISNDNISSDNISAEQKYKYFPTYKSELITLLKDKNVDLGLIDVSKIIDFSFLFHNIKRSNYSGIGKWDTSHVITMESMFLNVENFNEDISSWDTSNVRDMASMFEGAVSFNKNISKWNTSNVEDMSFMFAHAVKFNQDISKWNTSKVKDMNSMFYYAETFNQDISNWDLSSLEYMGRMFYKADSFQQPLIPWGEYINKNKEIRVFEAFSHEPKWYMDLDESRKTNIIEF